MQLKEVMDETARLKEAAVEADTTRRRLQDECRAALASRDDARYTAVLSVRITRSLV